MTSYRGYVYLIGSSEFGWYKIGQSRTPAIRIKTLGILLPFKIEVFAVWKTDNPGRLEATMHEKHSASHLNGEWFSFSWSEVSAILADQTPYPSVQVENAGVYVSNLKQNKLRDLPKLLGGMHFGQWIEQYLNDTGLEKNRENRRLARREVLRLFRGPKSEPCNISQD